MLLVILRYEGCSSFIFSLHGQQQKYNLKQYNILEAEIKCQIRQLTLHQLVWD